MTACASDQKSWCTPSQGWSWFTGTEDEEFVPNPMGIIGSLNHGDDSNLDGWLSMEECFQFANVTAEQWADKRGQEQDPKTYNGLTFDPPLIPRELYLSTDLNKDGTVNILDISIMAMAFGTEEGDEHYNSIADLAENNEVNILDISIVAMDYGKTV